MQRARRVARKAEGPMSLCASKNVADNVQARGKGFSCGGSTDPASHCTEAFRIIDLDHERRGKIGRHKNAKPAVNPCLELGRGLHVPRSRSSIPETACHVWSPFRARCRVLHNRTRPFNRVTRDGDCSRRLQFSGHIRSPVDKTEDFRVCVICWPSSRDHSTQESH